MLPNMCFAPTEASITNEGNRVFPGPALPAYPLPVYPPVPAHPRQVYAEVPVPAYPLPGRM